MAGVQVAGQLLRCAERLERWLRAAASWRRDGEGRLARGADAQPLAGGHAVQRHEQVDPVAAEVAAEALHEPFAVDQAHRAGDRKSTRLNSSHVRISYAVF